MGSEITQENIIPKQLPKKYTFTGPDVALPMVIKLQINNNFSVLRVFVNPMSKVDILYWSAFLKMKLQESMLKPCQGFLKGTFGKGLPVKGYIDLDTTFGKGENTKTIKVRYFVVESAPSFSIFNVVLGWPALKDLNAVRLSWADLTIEYSIGDGKVGVVEADLETAKKCHDMCPHFIM
ncbi:hypothetical protein MtrunA17_Chr5g0402221 [Medicago truncatula]|uniref:Uncharacterized protein n=1 Tax=Medicago truncatula TaxID=3880 RepID=A0A396HTI4_MEDTR|nr:hypothetical protein MtrunA17_Chr5g0402221 [Medicago truncatula]